MIMVGLYQSPHCNICVFKRTCTVQMTDNAPTFMTYRWWRWTLLLSTRAVICMCSGHTEVEAVKKKKGKKDEY